MKIKKNDNTNLDVKVISYTPNIKILYNLVELSSGKFRSIDRGVQSDRYESTLTFRGTKEHITELVRTLNELRANNKEVELSELEENFFGEHVNSIPNIKCVVSKMGVTSSPVFKVYTIEVSFLATNITYLSNSIPEEPLFNKFRCLQHDWSGTAEWNTLVNETYYSSNYFVNRACDTYSFTGDYVLKNNQVKDLYNFWKFQRGNELTVVDGEFGVTDMFGPQVTDSSHVVVINSITYDVMSAGYKRVTINLIKVG